MSVLMTARGQEAIRRPISGLSVLLALRRRPRTGDVQEMVETIDRQAYPAWEVRAWNGGTGPHHAEHCDTR